jgi:hypothetical protein
VFGLAGACPRRKYPRGVCVPSLVTVQPATVAAAASRRPARELRLRVPPHVVYRAFPGQTVVLNLQTGQYHALNESAGTMFGILSRGESLAVAASRVADQYGIPEATAERDLARLCASLLERGLLDSVEPIAA